MIKKTFRDCYFLLLIIATSFLGGVQSSICIADAPVNQKVLRIYHDADWSHHQESAQSIWLGAKIALSEVDFEVQGYRIELVKKDHGGNVARSLINNRSFLKDPRALAVLSGIHSPPLIKNRTFINENQILTLVPWAAGTPITRHPSASNWVFRLSLDDAYVGAYLTNYAVKKRGCSKPNLFLEQTPWGDANLKTMQKKLRDDFKIQPLVTRFNWSLRSYSAQSLLTENARGEYDCLILVSNAIEGARIAKAMSVLPADKRVPIISHWGITGGQFHKKINAKIREKLDLSFVQSCFSFLNEPLSTNAASVYKALLKQHPKKIRTTKDIVSPVGFTHAYDLTKIFIAAMHQVKLGDNMVQNRVKIKAALESLQMPVDGLIKLYEKPFSIFSKENQDAHEALSSENYCMANYEHDDSIKVKIRQND